MPKPPEPTVVTTGTLREWRLPEPADQKDRRGVAVIVAGSVPNPGAAMLSAEAALRSGAGKLQIVTAEPVATALAVAMPETLVKGSPATPEGDLDHHAAADAVTFAADADAVLIGPGILDTANATRLVEAVLPELSRGVVILDALALAWVTASPERLRDLPLTFVLTPNTHELALTLGLGEDDLADDEVPASVVELARRTGAVVTSGKCPTYTADADGNLWSVDVGNDGLAVAGSGDVKAGTILGLIARGAEPAQAVVWASYLHGMAGDRLASQIGPTGFLTRELPAQIPALLQELSV